MPLGRHLGPDHQQSGHFNASTTDAAAYNSYLMEESYLVVPTNGLSAAKAKALAQFIRYVLGPEGQQDIENFGAAPATAAMVAAGLDGRRPAPDSESRRKLRPVLGSPTTAGVH